MSYGANVTDACVRSASMPVASSRAQSLRTCRSCSRASSSWSSTPDRPDARPHCAAYAARPRRRGDRMMRRREFITLLGGARRRGRSRRTRSRPTAYRASGCSCSRARTSPNRRPTSRHSCKDCRRQVGPLAAICGSITVGAETTARRLNQHATELISLGPDVVLAGTGGTTPALRRVSRTVPIVFAQNIDPVGSGACREPVATWHQCHRLHPVRVHSQREMARVAAGNIAPRLSARAGGSSGMRRALPAIGQWAVILGSGRPGRRRRPSTRATSGEIQRAVSALAQIGNQRLDRGSQLGGVEPPRANRRARERATSCLPSIAYRHFVASGGLVSYGVDLTQPLPARGGLRRTVSSRARSPPTCRCRHRPSTSW